MRATTQRWKARNKNHLLLALMKELAGDAHISFEGDLQGTGLLDLPGASIEESEVLKRNTFWPKQGFVVLPLEADAVGPIIAAIGGTIPHAVIHIQIERAGNLEFGAYDNFHSQSMFFGDAVTQSCLDSLVAGGLLMRPVE